MKPFNLEAAKRGEPIVTRDGRPAKFLAHFTEPPKEMWRVVAMPEGSWPMLYLETGKFFCNSETVADLFMAESSLDT